MSDLIIWTVFGFIVGWLASIMFDSRRRQESLANICIGVIGALIGGFVSKNLGGVGMTGFNHVSFFTALIGSVLLVAVFRLLNKSSSTH